MSLCLTYFKTNPLERSGIDKYFMFSEDGRKKAFYLVDLIKQPNEDKNSKYFRRVVDSLVSDILRECDKGGINCNRSNVSVEVSENSKDKIPTLRSIIDDSIKTFNDEIRLTEYAEKGNVMGALWGGALLGFAGTIFLSFYYHNPNLLSLGLGTPVIGVLAASHTEYHINRKKNKLNELKKVYEIVEKSMINNLFA